MPLPLLLAVPHAGLEIPPEVAAINHLTSEQITADGDEGAAAIYLPLLNEVQALVTTPVARAFVDMNRAENDTRKDGVVKTHTCWDVPIYRRPLRCEEIETLIDRYHHPLPRGAEQGSKNGGGARRRLPRHWLEALHDCFEKAFHRPVSLNVPFTGGHTIRVHANELPWVQLELSRALYMSLEEKRRAVLTALAAWCERPKWEVNNLQP